jgi:hypothetical protein
LDLKTIKSQPKEEIKGFECHFNAIRINIAELQWMQREMQAKMDEVKLKSRKTPSPVDTLRLGLSKVE